ncbi:uncharacterized protein LOC101897961 isoform X2 [Musca domestica]|nr:uncharacterized protein LOC101897961 isoform X2 [Musca domestica]
MIGKNKFSPNCLIDCMYREYQIYDDDVETIDLEAAKNLLNEQIVNEEFNPVYGQAFERCSKFEKSALLEVFAFVNITNQNACDDYPMFMDSCVWAYTVANCPESHALQSAECRQKTEWVNKCLFKE